MSVKSMKCFLTFCLPIFSLLVSCGKPLSSNKAQSVLVYSSSATQPWLADLYNCASGSTAIHLSDFPNESDLTLRFGEPEFFNGVAYQVGEEEIDVLINQHNPISNLSQEQVQALFTGKIRNWQELGGTDALVQVWAFAAGEDIQQAFDKMVLEDVPVSSLARQAVDINGMVQVVATDMNAIGLIPSHFNLSLSLTDLERAVRKIDIDLSVPILALTPSVPKKTVRDLLACMKK